MTSGPLPAGSTTTTTSPTNSGPTTTTSTTLPHPLNVLLGTWTFTYTSGGRTFFGHYTLTGIEPADVGGYDMAVGTNVDSGNRVSAVRIQDVDPGNLSPYRFALLDVTSTSCVVFEFDITLSTARGTVFLDEGDCFTPTGTGPQNFTGVKG